MGHLLTWVIQGYAELVFDSYYSCVAGLGSCHVTCSSWQDLCQLLQSLNQAIANFPAFCRCLDEIACC